MTLYRDILKRSALITWKNKFLWFFGLFAAMLGGSGELEILTRDPSPHFSDNIFPGLAHLMPILNWQVVNGFGKLFVDDPLFASMTLLLILVVIALTIFIIWLAVISQVALVKNSADLSSGKKVAEKNGIPNGVMVGIKHFWRVFGANALIKFIIGIAFVIISTPIMAMAYKTNFVAFNLLFVLLFIMFIPVAVILAFIMKYAICYMVIKEDKFLDSIKKSWKLFRENWVVSIEMALVLFVASFLAIVFFVSAVSAIAMPLMLLSVAMYKILSFAGFWFMLLLSIILLFFVTFVGSAILITFQTSSWTLLFMKLDGGGATSKILRIFQKKD